MNKADTRDTMDLEELFDAEVPCGGNKPACIPCGRAAILRSSGHGCCPLNAQAFKCAQCWMAWYRKVVSYMNRVGKIDCGTCGKSFYDVDSFSHYRPI